VIRCKANIGEAFGPILVDADLNFESPFLCTLPRVISLRVRSEQNTESHFQSLKRASAGKPGGN